MPLYEYYENAENKVQLSDASREDIVILSLIHI